MKSTVPDHSPASPSECVTCGTLLSDSDQPPQCDDCRINESAVPESQRRTPESKSSSADASRELMDELRRRGYFDEELFDHPKFSDEDVIAIIEPYIAGQRVWDAAISVVQSYVESIPATVDLEKSDNAWQQGFFTCASSIKTVMEAARDRSRPESPQETRKCSTCGDPLSSTCPKCQRDWES